MSENLNLQLPTGSGLINESDLCYAGSEILVTFSSILATHHGAAERLFTHTRALKQCVCVYCHLAIRLQDSGVSQVRDFGLGSRSVPSMQCVLKYGRTQ